MSGRRDFTGRPGGSRRVRTERILHGHDTRNDLRGLGPTLSEYFTNVIETQGVGRRTLPSEPIGSHSLPVSV